MPIVSFLFNYDTSFNTLDNLTRTHESHANQIFNPIPFLVASNLVFIQVSIPFSTSSPAILIDNFITNYYNRIHVIPTQLNFGNIAATLTENYTIFNAFRNSQTLTSISPATQQGIRFSFGVALLPIVINAFQTASFQVTASIEAPPSFNLNYLFNFTGLSYQPVLNLIGTVVTLFAYESSNRSSESLEWLTEIITSDNSTEQRIKKRTTPRMTFNYTSFIPLQNLTEFENEIWRSRARRWAVPIWQESELLNTNVNKGETTIAMDTTFKSFKVGGIAVIFQTANFFFLGVIQSMTPTSITFNSEITRSFIGRFFVIPAVIGRFLSAPITSRRFNGEIQSQLTVTDVVDIAELLPTTTYNNEDVFTDDILLSGGRINYTYDRRIDLIDYQLGNRDYVDRWNLSRRSFSIQLQARNLEELANLRAWLSRRSGRFSPFYLPSKFNDFEIISTGQIVSQFDIKLSVADTWSSNRDRIAILINNTYEFRQITSIELLDDRGRVNLDSALNVDASEIKRISYLTLVRLARDEITFDYLGNKNSTVNLDLLEVA